MGKFSFYELFSFVAPGFGVILITKFYLIYVFGLDIINIFDKTVIDIFFLFTLALFIGILLQILTFSILKWKSLKWYKNIVFKCPNDISSKLKHISNIIPYLIEYYRKNNKHHLNKDYDKVTADDVFDLAYYYLEVNDKIGSTKKFQSMYFWLRNTLTVCLFNHLFSLFIFLYVLIVNNPLYSTRHAFLFLIFNLLLFLLLLYPTKWLREKMVIKLFWSFYTDLITKK